ncbi:hypothetical protein [Cryobacterium arcticum]|uniref:Secreted protein n=1 Tax=Cryobacterium arcticum TaxID=670052 RepID=A0A317ZZN1_9MICO|nr:hypothetical protein [Cryobacterium arcticum]PXA72793.1 hypothetical protein CTB96_01440 [Cryobacterium arcticum]
MKKFYACVIGVVLMALALSGGAAVSAADGGTTVAAGADSDSDLGDAPALPVAPPSEIEIAAIPNQEFAQLVGPVLDSLPNEYAFFYFDGEHKPVIGFVEKAVPAVMKAVTATGQEARIIEDAGFTYAEYAAAAEKVVADLHAAWPQDVPFPIIGERPDLGVGVIGAIRVTPDADANAAWSIRESTRLIQEADASSPFSIQIDDERVFGEGHTASYRWPIP